MIVVGLTPEGQDEWGLVQVTCYPSYKGELDRLTNPRHLPTLVGEVYVGIHNVYICHADAQCATPLAWWRKGIRVIHHLDLGCLCSLCTSRRKA